jgi:hypothetical protein
MKILKFYYGTCLFSAPGRDDLPNGVWPKRGTRFVILGEMKVMSKFNNHLYTDNFVLTEDGQTGWTHNLLSDDADEL